MPVTIIRNANRPSNRKGRSAELKVLAERCPSVSSAVAVALLLRVAHDAIERALGLEDGTLCSRAPSDLLTANEGAAFEELVSVCRHAVELFGNWDRAREWLTDPNLALGMIAPVTAFSEAGGFKTVDTLLGRIEHGIVS